MKFLLAKRLKNALKAVHNYNTDEVTIKGVGNQTTLKNQYHTVETRKQQTQQAKMPTCLVTDEDQQDDESSEVNVEITQGDTNIFTCKTDPFKPERVAEILQLVTIGNELSKEERLKVRHLISAFADIFALSGHEVHTVEGATHRLNIPPDATFTKRVHQKPLKPPQQQYLYKSIDTMLEAGIIEPCPPENVKCISPTTLAQKTH